MEMTTEAEDILIAAGVAMGRSKEQMKPLIEKIVTENWIETKDALASLSADQWRDMQVPIRLVNEVQTILSSFDSEPPKEEVSQLRLSVKAGPSEKEEKQEDAYLTAGRQLAIVDFQAPSEVHVPFSLSTATSNLRQFLTSHPDDALMALSNLLKIIDGVLRNPKDAKKRRVRLANETFHSRVGQFAESMEFLKAAGFQVIEPNLDLPIAFMSRLTDCRQILSSIMVEYGLEVPPLTTNGGPVNSVFQARLAQNAAIDVEIKQTEALLKTGGVTSSIPLNPKVFHISTLRKLDTAIRQANQEIEESTVDDCDYGGLSQDDIKRFQQNFGDGPSFKSRAKEHLEQLQKRKVHPKCILRVQFPDRLVLQLEFAPATRLSHVNSTIGQFLDPKLAQLDWHIYQSPPKRTFSPKKSLFEEGLVPGAVVYLKIDSVDPPPPPYILSHLLPPPVLQEPVSMHTARSSPAPTPSSPISRALSHPRPPPTRPQGDDEEPFLST